MQSLLLPLLTVLGTLQWLSCDHLGPENLKVTVLASMMLRAALQHWFDLNQQLQHADNRSVATTGRVHQYLV